MEKTRMILMGALFVLLGIFSTVSCDMTDVSGDADSDSDTDSDADTDVDAGGDSDTDSDDDPGGDCDCPDLDGVTPENLAGAMNICPGDYLLSAEFWSTAPSPNPAYGILPAMGSNDCLVAQHGCLMGAISTGPVGQANPNEAGGTELGSDSYYGVTTANDPLPPYQGDSPTSSTVYESCDAVQLKLSLRSPDWSEGISFDFLYGSAEYNEWINMGYNDAFYAILEHPDVNDGQKTNISFDSNGMEVEVDVNFFENADHPCDETGSGWEPAISGVSGSTGWLRTQWPLPPDTEFSLTFSIHDEGDCIYDSIVFIDNFQWLGDAPDPGTGPV